MARKNLDGYPTSFSNVKACVFVHPGPASYATVVIATPPTGGDTVLAAEAGMKAFDTIQGGMTSDDGQYMVQVISPNGNSASSSTAAQPTTTMKLRWIIAATGAEVANTTNLSARTIRLFAMGPK